MPKEPAFAVVMAAGSYDLIFVEGLIAHKIVVTGPFHYDLAVLEVMVDITGLRYQYG